MLFASLLVFSAVVALFVGLDRVIRSRTADIETRIEIAAAQQMVGTGQLPAARTAGLNRWLAEGASPNIAVQLARADLHLTVAEYIVLTVIFALLGFIVGFIGFRGNLVFGVGGLVLGYQVPRIYVARLMNKRINAFNALLADTVTLMASSLRSGYSFLQSLETVGREMNPPVSSEFVRVTREVGLGLTVQQALTNLHRRMPSDDLEMLITAVSIQHEVGGNLAEILDTIAFTIRERVRIKGEIRSITAMQRLSGSVLSLLPIILGLVLYALNPKYMAYLWENGCGIALLATGIVLTTTGFFVVRRLANIEV